MLVHNKANLDRTYSNFLNIKTSSNIRSYFDQEVKEQKKNKALRYTTFSILGVSLLTAGVFHKKAGTFLKKSKVYLQKMLDRQSRLKKQIAKFENTKEKSQTAMVLLRARYYTTKVISKTLTFYTNTDPIRNYFLGVKTVGLANKTKYTSFIAKTAAGITKKFGVFVKNASEKNYKKLENTVKETEKPVKEFIADLKKRPETKETAKIIEEEFNLLKENIGNLSKGNAKRAEDLEKRMVAFVEDYEKHIKEQVKNTATKDIKKVKKAAEEFTQENTDGFVAERIAKKHTQPWKQEIHKQRKAITNPLDYQVKQMDDLIDEGKEAILGISHKEVNLKSIRARMETIDDVVQKIANPKNKSLRQEFIKQFNKQIDIVIAEMSKNPEVFKKPLENYKKTKEILNNSKRGSVEKIREQMRKHKYIVDKEQYLQVKKALNKIKKATSGAVKFETDNLEGRLRDLVLGGGVFETVAAVVPLGLVTKQIAKKQTSEERKEKILKVGAPVLGSMGVWVYSAFVKSYNGPKAILLSLGSGIALNKLGAFITRQTAQGAIKQKD